MITAILESAARITLGLSRRANSLIIHRSLRVRRLMHASEIKSFTVPEELRALFSLGKECRLDANVLEIGSYLGASTCYIAAGLRGSNFRITCIDTWQNETMAEGARDTFEQFSSNAKPIREHLTMIRKRSGEVKSTELSGPFDLIFIDGDHSYDQTRADFLLVSELVAADGIVVFHDSLFFEGVSRVIGEAVASAKWQFGGSVRNLLWLKRANFTNRS